MSIKNTLLTSIGFVIGIPTGILLHSIIFKKAVMGDKLKFYPVISIESYVVTVIFTVLLIAIVTTIINKKMEKIQMIEALKKC